MILHPNPSQTT